MKPIRGHSVYKIDNYEEEKVFQTLFFCELEPKIPGQKDLFLKSSGTTTLDVLDVLIHRTKEMGDEKVLAHLLNAKKEIFSQHKD